MFDLGSGKYRKQARRLLVRPPYDPGAWATPRRRAISCPSYVLKMAFKMRNPVVSSLICLVFAALTPNIADAGCADPNLSAQIPEFQALQTSRISALLRLGETHHLCFGIEYVNTALLMHVTDIRTSAGTVRQAITSILGNDLFSVEVHDRVIEISGIPTAPNVRDVFDYILPAFEARRGPMQEVSNLLHMYLVTDLSPEVSGFSGHYFPGDLKDEVGPFR